MSPVFNALCIPQAQVVVACDEYLVRVRKLFKPVDEVENFFLRPVLREVLAMNQDVSFREVLQLMVLAVGVRYLDDSHYEIQSLIITVIIE